MCELELTRKIDEKCKKDIADLSGMSLSRHQLIAHQMSDKSLSKLFENAVTGEACKTMSPDYLVKDGVLMRKWTQLNISSGEK